jgi:hypothetical protein
MTLIERAWERDHFTCKMCPAPAATIAFMVSPRLGGKLELSNVLSMCRSCVERQRREGGLCAAGGVETAPNVRIHLRRMSEMRKGA